LYKFVTCIFIYISVTFIVFAATMFMVNKDYQNLVQCTNSWQHRSYAQRSQTWQNPPDTIIANTQL